MRYSLRKPVADAGAGRNRRIAICRIGCCFMLSLACPGVADVGGHGAEAHAAEGRDEAEVAEESAGTTWFETHRYDPLNMTLVDSLHLEGVTDLYVAGNHAYVGDDERGVLHIVDISQPQDMRLDTSLTLFDIPSVDVKVSGNLAVVGAQRDFAGEAIFIDISDPSNPEVLSRFEASDRGGVHNLFLYKDRAYLASSIEEGLTIVDISDPTRPFQSGFWMNESEEVGSYVHDVFIRDDMAFLSVDNHRAYSGGLVILDLADPDHPVTLCSMPIAAGLHSAWMEEGFVYCNQEYGDWRRRLHVIDATDPRHPVEVSTFGPHPPPFVEIMGPHNPHARDGLLYWAYYDAGVRVFDLATPDQPVEIAYFPSSGAWGAQPHTDGLVYVADHAHNVHGIAQHALLALRFDEPAHGIRQISLSADSSIAGRSDWIAVRATTTPSPRGISGQIARVSARFFNEEETEEWMLADDGETGDAARGGRSFRGQIPVPPALPSGKHRIRVQLEDDQARVYPHDVPFYLFPEDLVLYGDGLAGEWREIERMGGGEFDLRESEIVYRGESALAFRDISNFFRVLYEPIEPVDAFGFASLHLALHLGDVGANFRGLTVDINEELVPLVNAGKGYNGVDLDSRQWQLIDIPLDFLELDEITRIGFVGRLSGTLYLDDIRVVAGTPSSLADVVATAVRQEHTTSLPRSFNLHQNYPNPFNSGTEIRFSLPEGENVELTLYNLAGQRVAELASGRRDAGTYTVYWDGRGDDGGVLASGVYLYRLEAGARADTRRLLLLR